MLLHEILKQNIALFGHTVSIAHGHAAVYLRTHHLEFASSVISEDYGIASLYLIMLEENVILSFEVTSSDYSHSDRPWGFVWHFQLALDRHVRYYVAESIHQVSAADVIMENSLKNRDSEVRLIV